MKESTIKRFGSEEKAKAYYREMQKKSRKNYSGKGGFASMDEERRKEISRMGVEARLGKDKDDTN